MRMKVLAGLWLASLLCAQSLPEMRMLPAEMTTAAVGGRALPSAKERGRHADRQPIWGPPRQRCPNVFA